LTPPPAVELGGPSNFRHQTHIGFDKNTGGFVYDSLPTEWKNLFEMAGLSSKDVADASTAQFLVNVINDQLNQNKDQASKPLLSAPPADLPPAVPAPLTPRTVPDKTAPAGQPVEPAPVPLPKTATADQSKHVDNMAKEQQDRHEKEMAAKEKEQQEKAQQEKLHAVNAKTHPQHQPQPQPLPQPQPQPQPQSKPQPEPEPEQPQSKLQPAQQPEQPKTATEAPTEQLRPLPPPPPKPNLPPPKLTASVTPTVGNLLDDIRKGKPLNKVNPTDVNLKSATDQEVKDMATLLKQAMAVRRIHIKNEHESASDAAWDD